MNGSEHHPAVNPDLVERSDAAAPAEDSPAYGLLRQQVLDAATLAWPARIPTAAYDDLFAWLHQVLAPIRGRPCGLDPVGVPPAYCGVLRWAGVPLARGGELVWGRDCHIEAGVGRPEVGEGILRLPESSVLAAMTSLGLKPLRAFFADRLGLRLQIGTGVGMYLWQDRAVLVSSAPVPLTGFLHGPRVDQRSNLVLQPGGWQTVELNR